MKSAQLVDLVSDGECEGEGVVEETFAASSTQPAKLKKHEYPEWYDPLKEDSQLPPEFWDMCTHPHSLLRIKAGSAMVFE